VWVNHLVRAMSCSTLLSTVALPSLLPMEYLA
jgi:hypothetical protein